MSNAKTPEGIVSFVARSVIYERDAQYKEVMNEYLTKVVAGVIEEVLKEISKKHNIDVESLARSIEHLNINAASAASTPVRSRSTAATTASKEADPEKVTALDAIIKNAIEMGGFTDEQAVAVRSFTVNVLRKSASNNNLRHTGKLKADIVSDILSLTPTATGVGSASATVVKTSTEVNSAVEKVRTIARTTNPTLATALKHKADIPESDAEALSGLPVTSFKSTTFGATSTRPIHSGRPNVPRTSEAYPDTDV